MLPKIEPNEEFRVGRFLREHKLFSGILCGSLAVAISYGVWDFYIKQKLKTLETPSINQKLYEISPTSTGVESLVKNDEYTTFVSESGYIYGITKFLDTSKNY